MKIIALLSLASIAASLPAPQNQDRFPQASFQGLQGQGQHPFFGQGPMNMRPFAGQGHPYLSQNQDIGQKLPENQSQGAAGKEIPQKPSPPVVKGPIEGKGVSQKPNLKGPADNDDKSIDKDEKSIQVPPKSKLSKRWLGGYGGYGAGCAGYGAGVGAGYGAGVGAGYGAGYGAGVGAGYGAGYGPYYGYW